MRRILFFAIASAIGGCSLFVDLDGLNGGGDTSDVFVPSDASGDAGVDARAPIDAGSDASSFVCPDAAIVCDDFDDDSLGARWTATQNQNGTLVIDDGGAFSPPNSLHVELPDNPGSSQRVNNLSQDFDSLSSLDCQFKIRLGSTDDTEGDDVWIFKLSVGATGFVDYEIDMNMLKATFNLEQDTDTGEDGGALSTVETYGAVSAGTWQTIRLTTDFKRAQVYLDGVVVYDKALVTPFPGSSATGTFAVGNSGDGEPASWDYRIDDVVCTGQAN